MPSVREGRRRQAVHVLDAYNFASNSYWENGLGLDLGYPQPLPTGTELLSDRLMANRLR